MSREDHQMKIRLPAELRDKIVSSADAGKRSLNAEIIARLETTFAGDDYADRVAARLETIERDLKEMNQVNRLVVELARQNDLAMYEEIKGLDVKDDFK